MNRSRLVLVGRLVALALLLTPAAVGCSRYGGRTPEEAEKLSQSEQDMAVDLWLRQGKARAAMPHALQAVEIYPQNYEAAHLVALLYLQLCESDPASDCRLDKAEKYVRQALSVQPDYREAQNTLGIVLIHQAKYREAIGVFEPLSQDLLYQTPEIAWGNLGWAYLEVGEIDLAVDALERAVAVQPQFCVGHFRLGLAHEKKEQWAAAVESFDRAVTVHEQCAGLQEAYLGRARVLLRLGRGSEAREDLTRCVELSDASEVGRDCLSRLGQLK